MLIAAACLPGQAIAIAPPLGIPIRQSTEQRRGDGRGERVFRIEREIVFRADPDGFAATIVQRSADAQAPAAERERYRRANLAMADRPVTVRLDRQGGLRAVDDLDTIWAAWRAGLGDTTAANALVRQIDALRPDQRRGVIGIVAAGLFADVAERCDPRAGPTTLASPAPFAGGTLAGTIMVTRGPTELQLTTRAEGRVGDAAAPGTAKVTIDRRIDLATGLVRDAERRERIVAPGGTLTTLTRTTLAW